MKKAMLNNIQHQKKWCVAVCAGLITLGIAIPVFAQTSDYTLTVPSSDIGVNTPFSVFWTAPAGADLTDDWIGIYQVGADDQSYVTFRYTDESASESLTFTLEATGTYVARYFKNNGYNKVATSVAFEVTATGGGNYALTAPSSDIGVNTPFNVSWVAPEDTDLTDDWVGIYRVGEDNEHYLAYEYTNNAREGSASFTIGAIGTYEARYFKHNGYAKVATSATFEVTAGGGGGSYTLTVPSSDIGVNTPFSVFWTAPAGADLTDDWIGIYQVGTDDQSYVTFRYTDESASESLTFTLEAAGTYEARYFKNSGYNRVTTSAQFEVTATGGGDYALTAPQGETEAGTPFAIAWNAPQGVNLTDDWIGIYAVGADDHDYLQFQFTDGTTQGSLTFTLNSPGSYEARYFKNNAYIRVTASAPFTISGGIGYALTATPNEVPVAEPITVAWITPANTNLSQDWVGLFRVSASDGDYLDWQYIEDRGNNTTFAVQTPGTYEFRYFKHNGFTRTATSNTVTVIANP